jgi:cyclomaltodextrin glucanotransferase
MPEFRDQVLYFIVTDRFCDGNPQNNTGKDAASYDATRTHWYMYWGGDLLGIIKRLDYLRGMGISAIWITPVFDQVDSLVQMAVPMSPYHGYWAKDFKRIDEHLVEDPEHVRVFARRDTIFHQLIEELHRRGIKLILDVVCNHSSPTTPGARGELFDDGRKLASYDEDTDQWYHHAGEVVDWNNLDEVQSKSFCGLSDFNEESFAFRSYIKSAIKLWIDLGCDGLRIDTVKHMPLWFWQEFSGDLLKSKPDLFMFGEWFMGGVYDPAAVEFANRSGMSMLDFALCFALQDALGKDRSMREIEDVIRRDGAYHSATELVTFVDNHDLPRFLSMRNDLRRLRMAVGLILCGRGIPCIYYGTEQGLHNDTDEGKDPYNRPMMERWAEDSPLYQDIARLAELRRKNRAVQKGCMLTRAITDDVYVFERMYMGDACLVALNKGPEQRIPVGPLGLPDGVYTDTLGTESVHVQGGRTELLLPPDSLLVFHHTQPPLDGAVVITLHLNGYRVRPAEGLYVIGDCPELGSWDTARALPLQYINDNTYSLDVVFSESAGRIIRYKYLARDAAGHLTRENGMGHYYAVPASGRDVRRDEWQVDSFGGAVRSV